MILRVTSQKQEIFISDSCEVECVEPLIKPLFELKRSHPNVQ